MLSYVLSWFDWVGHIGTLMPCIEVVAYSWSDGGVIMVGFKPYLKDQLVSFSALTLLVWSYDL